jgi:hypothetical protein
MVVGCRFPAGRAGALIDKTNAYFRARGYEPTGGSAPGDEPADLEARLVAKGYVTGEEQIAMAVYLEQLNQDFSPPAGLAKHGWLTRLRTDQSLVRNRKRDGRALVRPSGPTSAPCLPGCWHHKKA